MDEGPEVSQSWGCFVGGKIRAQGVPGLVLTCCWAGLDHRGAQGWFLPTGRWGWGPVGPRAGDGSLVDRYGSQILWLLGPGVLDCCFGLLVDWASAQGVLSHWGMRLVPRLGLVPRWVETVPGVSACRAPGGPRLLLHTGEWGWVLGPLVDVTGTQDGGGLSGVLRPQACWWVGCASSWLVAWAFRIGAERQRGRARSQC